MKTCILVTGSTGSGKSTLVDSMGKWFHTVHSGDLVRAAAQKIKEGGVIAPDSFNTIVKDALFAAVASHDTVIAECFPRNYEQVGWIRELRDAGVVVSVVRTVCDIEVRKNRVQLRDFNDPERYALDVAKIEQEGSDDAISGYFARMLRGVPHTVIDTSHTSPNASATVRAPNDIDRMIRMAECVRSRHTMAFVDLSRCATRAVQELEEFKRAVESAGTPKDSMLEELIDALYFVMVAVGGMGYEGHDVLDMFTRKFVVNVHRVNTGSKPHATISEVFGDEG